MLYNRGGGATQDKEKATNLLLRTVEGIEKETPEMETVLNQQFSSDLDISPSNRKTVQKNIKVK